MLIIDHREPKEIKEYLLRKNVLFAEKHLLIGDFIVNKWHVERKTWSDFFASYQTGRLFTQMLQLAQQQRGILLLEGFTLAYIQKKQMFYSLIVKIACKYNIKIIHTENHEHTAAFLIALQKNTFDEEKKEECAFPKLIPSMLSPATRKKQILLCFPHIGNKKAEKILAGFSSLRAFFIAPSKVLKQFGIGKKTEEEMERIIGE